MADNLNLRMANEEITNEVVRMLVNDEIDIYESQWITKAMSFLSASKRLLEKYPNSYVCYGLVAMHTIAINLKTRAPLLNWNDVLSNLIKMFDYYDKDDDLAVLWSDICSKIIRYAEIYVKESHEYVEQLDDNFRRQNPDAKLNEQKEHDLKLGSNYRSLQLASIFPLKYLIDGFEKYGVPSDDWEFKFFKANFLSIVCEALKPYDIWYGDTNEWIRIQVPISEREYAISVYDELIAEGVDKYKEFEIYKDQAYCCNPAFGDTPKTIWRGDITKDARRILGKLTPEDRATDNKKYGIGSLFCSISFIFAAAIPFFISEHIFWGVVFLILGILCGVASVLFLKDYFAFRSIFRHNSLQHKDKEKKDKDE